MALYPEEDSKRLCSPVQGKVLEVRKFPLKSFFFLYPVTSVGCTRAYLIRWGLLALY